MGHDGTLKMKFGKHRDKTIEEIPSDYLQWMCEELDNDKLVDAADAEYQFREKHNTHFYDED